MKKLIALAIPIETWRKIKAHLSKLDATTDKRVTVSAWVRDLIDKELTNDTPTT